jgi:serine/threonine-protein kinase HipA
MALGDNRHYRINTISPRHFVQTAGRAGVGEGVANSIFTELRDIAKDAIVHTLDHLPTRFPKEVSASIRTGFLRRLALIQLT